MLTKKQRWRRVRVLRSNSTGSFSSTDSSSGTSSGGSNSSSNSGSGSGSISGRDGDTREGFFPASTDRSMASTSTTTTTASTDRSMASTSTTAAAAAPEGTIDGATPTPPPPPLPPPQQRAPPAPPHEAAAAARGLDRNNADEHERDAKDAKTVADPSSTSPTPSPPGGRPQQREHQQPRQQHPNNACGAGNAAPNHRHPLEAWKISALNVLKFLFFFDNNGGHDDGRTHHHHHGRGFGGGGGGGGASRDRAATEGCHPLTAVSSARPRRPSEPAVLPPRSRVRFSHQIRVILVASRVEMSSVKADVWWGEKDYCDFR